MYAHIIMTEQQVFILHVIEYLNAVTLHKRRSSCLNTFSTVIRRHNCVIKPSSNALQRCGDGKKKERNKENANNLGLTIVYVPIILADNDTPMQLNLFIANKIFRLNALPHGHKVSAVPPVTLFVLPRQTTHLHNTM